VKPAALYKRILLRNSDFVPRDVPIVWWIVCATAIYNVGGNEFFLVVVGSDERFLLEEFLVARTIF
jgi:hypothetical protein